tara:strand:+ start:888 stop:1133 length:246 start_codon:yes stop_codon:yes gene_type:complete
MQDTDMTKDKRKLKAQVKSRWYYIFWGAATVSVFAGQIFVGNGFRRMAESFDRIVDGIVVELEEEKNKWDRYGGGIILLSD